MQNTRTNSRNRHVLFHHSFLNILRGEDPLDLSHDGLCKDIDIDSMPRSAETVVHIAPIMLQGVKREQELVETNKDYYVAKDISTNTYYMCYKNVLMIDIDIHKLQSELSEADVLKHFSGIERHCFKIYKSRNGYHVFCLSRTFEYRDKTTVDFMLTNFSDFYYTVYSYIRGWSVRLKKNLPKKVSCIRVLV